MKSIVEEASSIAKAIEKAWARAGKPEEFSVKIFEDAEKNFFGFTTKSAKIAIFFQNSSHDTQSSSHRYQKNRDHQSQPRDNKKPTPSQPKHTAHPQQQKQASIPSAQHTTNKPQFERLVWNDELINSAKTWVHDCLSLLGLNHISFDMTSNGNLLKIELSAPLTQEKNKERYLFKSIAHLILESLSQQFKKNVKGLKITISTLSA